MYNIGDNIIYGMSGIMTIVDIKNINLTGEAKDYYLLCDYGKSGSSVTYVPMDNPKLIENMHRLLSPDEIRDAIAEARLLSDVEWIPDSRARSEAYRQIIRSARRSEILAMIRTVHNTGLSRAAIGKKNFLADEGVMQKAESVIITEFSISLDIPESEARRIIDRDIKGIPDAPCAE